MARAARKSSRSSTADAVALLKQDHATVKQQFKDFEKAEDAGEKQAIAELICKMLTVHATIEEEIFYPAAREVLEEDDLIDEAEVEHATAKDLIRKIESHAEPYDANVKVLGEYINHHVEEEQTDIFPKVKRAGMDTKDVGKRLALRKRELLTELGLLDEGDLQLSEEDEDEDLPRGGSRKRNQGESVERRQARSGGSTSRRTNARGRRGN